MSWSKRITKFSGALLFLVLSACGVKGDPVPPDRPPTLGRGRPTYRRATEGIKIEKTQRTEEQDEDKDKEDDDE